MKYSALILLSFFSYCTCVQAQHEVLLHGKSGLAIISKAGETTWKMPFGGIHDIHVLGNGNIMVQRNMHEIV